MSEQTIAVVGASTHRHKFGNKCVRAYRHAGWQVIPVNPNADEVEGIPTVATVADIPRPIDRISVYLPPEVTLTVLDDIARACKGGCVESVYFNPGAADRRVLTAAKAAGIPALDACSIVAIGLSPSQFP